MNSYGSVSLVSQAIYRVLRYMNFFPTQTTSDQSEQTKSADDDTGGNTDSRIIIDPAQLVQQPSDQPEQPEQLEQLEPENSESVKEIIVAIS